MKNGVRCSSLLVRSVIWMAVVQAAVPLRGGTEYEEAKRLVDSGTRAVIWYLGHSGWAVRTREHLLVFDYWEYRERTSTDRMATGFIDPLELAGSKVRVFVSHRHADHYDPRIQSWKDAVRNIRYVFGWNPDDFSPDLTFNTRRQSVTLEGVAVANVFHSFDDLPESAFMVHVDGLWIYHAGDHGHSQGKDHAEYKSNIDYLASLSDRVDLVFLPTFGGADYAIDRLNPEVAVPMHSWDDGTEYSEFQVRARDRHPNVRVFAATAPGDSFHY